MNGIHAAFTGRIGKGASFPVVVDAKADARLRRRGCGWRCSASAFVTPPVVSDAIPPMNVACVITVLPEG